jgi:hypothetical protein
VEVLKLWLRQHLNFSTILSFVHCRTALKLVPHGSFTFAKLWLLAATLEAVKCRCPALQTVLASMR